MSPFSKVEMSPFVVVKKHLQHERCGAGGSPTTDEPKRANTTGSHPTSKAQDAQTKTGGGAVVNFSASGETALQSLPDQWRHGPGFQATWPAFQQSLTGKDNQQSTAIVARSLL